MIDEQTITEHNATMLDVMKNRNFLKIWMAQIMSQTAQQIVNIALVLQVSAITGSSTATSGIIISFTVPAILFAAIAGVFVERNSKKTVLVLTNLGRGIMVLGYLLTDTRWGAGAVLPIFYITTLLFSSVSQFFNPAEASMIPLLVKKEELVAANSLFNLTLPATQLGGFVLLGPLLLATVFNNNFNGLYIVIFIFCVAAAALTYFLPQDRPADTAAARRQRGENVGVSAVASGATEIARSGFHAAWDELVEGGRFIRRDPVIVSAIIYWSIAIAVFMMLGTIGPLFLNKVLNIDQSRLFYILVPGGIGLVLGVIMVGKISNPNNREKMINWGLMAAGITLVVFSLAYPVLAGIYKLSNHIPSEPVVLALMGLITLVLGLSNSFISVPAQTALQERSPEDIRARVFSAFYTVQNVIIIVPVLLAGVLADSFGYIQTVIGIGAVVMLTAGIGLYNMRKRVSSAPATPAENAVGTQPTKGHVATLEEKEAAVMIVTPAPRPVPAAVRQKEEEAHEQNRA